MTSVTVAVTGARDVDVVLARWLRDVPQLRGAVQREQMTPSPGEQGVSGDLVVALASTGAATALVTSLQVWLTNRHTDVTITVTGPQGRQVTVEAARAHDMTQVQELLIAALAADANPHPEHLAEANLGEGPADQPPPTMSAR